MEIMLCAVVLCLTVATSATPISKFSDSRLEEEFNSLYDTIKLEADDSNPECMFLYSTEGVYSFESLGTTGETVCGLYVIAEPDQTVELQFQNFDISCSKGGLLSVVDGWELNGQFFPSPEDHPLPAEQRYTEMCGGKAKTRKPFRTHQNVALVEFRVPAKGQGFVVLVTFRPNPKPCNVVLQKYEGAYTLRNYHGRRNCSVSVIFPLSVHVLASSVGVQGSPLASPDFETGLLSKCRKRGMHDFIEIRGGDGLDPNLMRTAVDYCGVKSTPSETPVTVACGNTAVRLVSSGRFENSFTFSFAFPDFSSTDLECAAFLRSLQEAGL